MKKEIWGEKNIKHIYNRGTEKRVIFQDRLDAYRFIKGIEIFNTKDRVEFYELMKNDGKELALRKSKLGPLRSQSERLVAVHGYCLCINHYHLVLEELTPGGISLFMQKFGAAYVKYFNYRHVRSGRLFQGTYKKRDIEANEDLANVSAYVHKNFSVHDISQNEKTLFSSYQEMFDEEYQISLLDKNVLPLDQVYIDETVAGIKNKRADLKRELLLE